MKKILNGKLYDTATAQQVCELTSTEHSFDFSWHETYLYRTKNGAFFIAGRGNAASIWAEPCCGGGRTSGEGLRLLDEWEAREYMESADCTVADYATAGLDVGEG